MSVKDPAETLAGDPIPEGHEAVTCWCGADDCSVVLPAVPSGRLVRCNKCGMHYVNPRRLRSMISSADDGLHGLLDEDKVREPERWRRTFDFRLRLMNKHAPKKGKLLDVGCYGGFFLNAAREAGWEVYGIEPAAGGARYARETFGLDVKHGILEEGVYPAGEFDVLGLLEVIEHVPNPDYVIEQASRVVKPGGLILVETPTINNIWFRLFKGKWRHFISCHFWFFSENELVTLLRKHGFESVQVVRVGRYTSLRHLIGVLKQHFKPLANIADCVLIKWLRLGGVTLYINPGDNMLVIARKKG